MRVAYIGNHSTPHSTESHVALALEANGHTVARIQEARDAWHDMPWKVAATEPDFVLWTTTYDYAPPSTFELQRSFMAGCRVPIVGYHLDLWWGLDREQRVAISPFFRADLVCTADGGHDDRWAAANVNHAWFAPAVSRAECEPGTHRPELAADVVFVGSWQGGYHAESTHRHELVRWLKRRGCVFYPRPGEHALRGGALRDLYASAKVVVGDSCMAGRYVRYWSDRIPETTGRGAFLLHPYVEGLAAHHPRLVTWKVHDWEHLAGLVDMAVDDDEWRADKARQNRDDTLERNTYERRMEQLVALLAEQAMVAA